MLYLFTIERYKFFQGVWPIADAVQSKAFQKQAGDLIILLEKKGYFPQEVFMRSHLQTASGERFSSQISLFNLY